jgi:oxygen-dependent protoporphyrinogen oxidase
VSESEVLIIGGGISGLSTAWWLAQQGIGVEVWETAEHPGGKIQSTREAGYLSERSAGLLVNFRPQVDRLIQQAGLETRKQSRNDRLNRYVIHQGHLASVPMEIPAMAISPLWSWKGKLRMLAEILIPGGGSADESVARFITRRLGREILETAIDPFVTGTLASDPELASAQAVLPRLTALEQRYGSITLGMLINRVLKRRRANRAETFSFSGGMSDLVQSLASTPGIHLRTGLRATGIERIDGAWQVTGESAQGPHHTTTPQLIISTPADGAARLLGPLDRQLASLLDGIEYAPVAVLHMGLRRERIAHPLDGTGFLVPRREPLGFNGNLWMSNLFPGRAPEDHILLTSYLGGMRNPRQVEQTDQQMVTTLLTGLAPLLGIQGEPEYLRIDRHRRGLPLYHGDYLHRTREIRTLLTAHPGLHLCANYLGGVSVRERIHRGMQTARQIGERLRQPQSTHREDTGAAVTPIPIPTGSYIGTDRPGE